MLTVINFKNALEEVTNLDFDALVSREDQVANKVYQEGASFGGLVDAS